MWLTQAHFLSMAVCGRLHVLLSWGDNWHARERNPPQSQTYSVWFISRTFWSYILPLWQTVNGVLRHNFTRYGNTPTLEGKMSLWVLMSLDVPLWSSDKFGRESYRQWPRSPWKLVRERQASKGRAMVLWWEQAGLESHYTGQQGSKQINLTHRPGRLWSC